MIIRNAEKHLQQGEQALAGQEFQESIEQFRLGIAVIGNQYLRPGDIDDTGMKMTLAQIEEKNQRLVIAANILKKVLQDRLHFLKQNSLE